MYVLLGRKKGWERKASNKIFSLIKKKVRLYIYIPQNRGDENQKSHLESERGGGGERKAMMRGVACWILTLALSIPCTPDCQHIRGYAAVVRSPHFFSLGQNTKDAESPEREGSSQMSSIDIRGPNYVPEST